MTFRLLSDRELRNFGTFLRRTGINRPQGAFDALPASMRRLPGRGLPMNAFARGGAFDDEADVEELPPNAMSIIRRLARSCDDDEWAQFRSLLLGEEAEDDRDLEPDDEAATSTRGQARRSTPAMDSRARASFLKLYPEARHLQVDPYQPTRPTPETELRKTF